jgi:anti-sigma B factor antagonist
VTSAQLAAQPTRSVPPPRRHEYGAPVGSSFQVDPVQHDDGPHAWQLGVSGDLDASTAQLFNAAIDDVIERGAQLVVLDLTAVDFLDSTGLRSIVRASTLLTERDGRLTVTGLSGAAERVLELTGLLERLRDPDD